MQHLRLVAGAALALAVAAAIYQWRVAPRGPGEPLFEGTALPLESAPLSPWREPEHDVALFFPQATRHTTETVILSGLSLELARQLGRFPTADELALHVNPIFQNEIRLGSVLVRRVKGEHGAIELVLALDPAGIVRGCRIQRIREPEKIAEALLNSAWLDSFKGKSASDQWRLGGDIPPVPAEALSSASAIVEGLRSSVLLFRAANDPINTASLHRH